MNREEEIRQAVREYTDVAKSYLLGDEIELVRNAYEAGAEWADEHPINPWHSVADGDFPEYPEGDAIGPNYLVITKRGYGIMEIFSDYFMYIENGDYKFVPVEYWMEIPQLLKKGDRE